jgi:hypothetical protein
MDIFQTILLGGYPQDIGPEGFSPSTPSRLADGLGSMR